MTDTDNWMPIIMNTLASLKETVEAQRCVPPPVGCGGQAVNFRDQLSVTEYKISGLCQACQDSVFGVGDEYDESD